MALSSHDAFSHSRGRRRRRGRGRALSEINVTPLVDVMLVLLIVFMVSAPLLTVGVPVELPKTEAGAMEEQTEPLTVSIRADGAIFLQQSETAFADLGDRLQALAGSGFDKPVYVRADGRAPYARVAQVMARLQAAASLDRADHRHRPPTRRTGEMSQTPLALIGSARCTSRGAVGVWPARPGGGATPPRAGDPGLRAAGPRPRPAAEAPRADAPTRARTAAEAPRRRPSPAGPRRHRPAAVAGRRPRRRSAHAPAASAQTAAQPPRARSPQQPRAAAAAEPARTAGLDLGALRNTLAKARRRPPRLRARRRSARRAPWRSGLVARPAGALEPERQGRAATA